MLDKSIILDCLRHAKLNYAIYMSKTRNEEVRYGMCKFIRKELDKYMTEQDDERVSYKVIQKYIPEFNWKTLEGDDRLYWWPMNDFNIRFKMFDKLIEIYSLKFEISIKSIYFKFVNIKTGPLCNGNTADFGSAIPSSNLGGPTKIICDEEPAYDILRFSLKKAMDSNKSNR